MKGCNSYPEGRRLCVSLPCLFYHPHRQSQSPHPYRCTWTCLHSLNTHNSPKNTTVLFTICKVPILRFHFWSTVLCCDKESRLLMQSKLLQSHSDLLTQSQTLELWLISTSTHLVEYVIVPLSLWLWSKHCIAQNRESVAQLKYWKWNPFDLRHKQ